MLAIFDIKRDFYLMIDFGMLFAYK